jgi:integrase/recombinase XerD
MKPQLEAYLAGMKARKYCPTTLRACGDKLKSFSAFLAEIGAERLQDVTADHIEQYRLRLIERKVAHNTVYDSLRNLRAFFNYLEKEQVIFVNPTRSLVMPKYLRHLLPVPTEKDVKRILVHPDVSGKIGIRDRALIEVAYSTGARLQELVRMNLLSIDRTQRSIRVFGKGRKERILPLGRHAMFWLEAYLRDARPKLNKLDPDEPALWLGLHGKRIHPQSIQVMLREYSIKAKIKPLATPHALRRACATHMLRRGAHPVQIQMLLGHATLDNLSQYIRVTITDMQKAYEQSNPAK